MTREFTNEDCMELMARYPDKHFDLAIVDPPYGVEKSGKAPSRLKKYGQLKSVNDSKPNSHYFSELRRVSKHQIIWGYNHLANMIGPSKSFIFWYKHQPVDTYADGELAFSSFDKNAKCFDFPYFGAAFSEKDRIHPTQKPVALYKWLLTNYAKPGDLILDTHVGSASSLIACEEKGFEYVACELDPDYFAAANERIRKYRQQLRIDFEPPEPHVPGTQLRIK